MIYEGTVKGVIAREEWLIIDTEENVKPLGLRNFKGELPKVGQIVSVEANDGKLWVFGEHRSLVIRNKPLPRFVVTDYYPQLKLRGKVERVVEIVLAKFHLEGKKQLTGDDIVKEIAEAFPDNSPRIAGIGFQLLSRKKIIHIVSYAPSIYGHHRRNPVWEITKQ